MPRVTFQENEVAVVHTYESLNKELSTELFYQVDDYIRFRSDYRVFKAEQQRKQQLKRLSSQAPFEQQIKMAPADRRASCASPYYRRSRQPQGIALMA